MRRSQRITLGMVPVVAATFLAGCSDPQHKACVDQKGTVVADTNCAQASAQGTTTGAQPFVGGYPYAWYWFRGNRPVIGALAPRGGSYAAPATRRGGFGSTASGRAVAG